ncbi:hypothetical protein Ddye_013026 [Dipteronia dyeriana]|uniref:Uncharacterized protein n=1 Tax=Dipteronia dyeriana TaxID=168575 RepID=A0AAE0CJ92_9ROSI|nr:hypothetical protein Ddye_013026 [Dipteronia dyeriana]
MSEMRPIAHRKLKEKPPRPNICTVSRAISRHQEDPHMKRKVLKLSESSNKIKGKLLILMKSTSNELF